MSTSSPSPFASAHTRAQLAQALLLSNAGLAVVSVLVLLFTGGAAAATGGDVAALEEEINPAELAVALVALLQFAVYVATAVVFLMWLHRAYKNVQAFGVRTELSPGWAVGHWFIPFANLIRPYQSVKEMWIKSDPGVGYSKGYAEPGLTASTTTLVGVWWAAWLISNFFDRFYDRLAADAETADQLSTATSLGVASDLLTVVAAVLAFLVVKAIDRMQEEKAAQLRLSAWPEPPPPPASFDDPPAPA